MSNITACLTSNSNEWATPSTMYKRFMIKGYFDPCPLNHIVDGLSIAWEELTYVNPPYSDINLWINKAIYEFESKHCVQIIMLIPARTDTQWFKKLVELKYTQIQFIEGRLKFNDSKSAPFPSMFVIFNNCMIRPKFVYLRKEDLKELYEKI